EAAHGHLVRIGLVEVEGADEIARGPQPGDHGAPARAAIFRNRLAFAENSHSRSGVALAPDDLALAVAMLAALRQHHAAALARNRGEYVEVPAAAQVRQRLSFARQYSRQMRGDNCSIQDISRLEGSLSGRGKHS